MADPMNCSDNRIKGQDVTILITQDGNLLGEFNEISNFEFTDEIEQISKGYLGQKSEKKDMIFKGVKGSFQLDIATQDYFKFRNAVVNKAKRITPDVEFNIAGVFAFPNGDTPTISFQCCSFGELPVNVSNRNEYVNVKISFASEDTNVTFA